MHRTLLIIVLLLVAAYHMDASPAEDEIQLIAKSGYANLQRENAWNPITIQIENPFNSVEGTIHITTGYDRNTTILRDVKIGKGTFLYHMYYFCDSPGGVTVDLRQGRDSLLKAPSVMEPTFVEEQNTICLVMGSVSGLTKLRRMNEQAIQLAYLSEPREMPDSWTGYDFADYLVLSSTDLSNIRQEQKQAVLDWVSTGGKIVVTTGQDWQYVRDSFLSEILPVGLTGTTGLPAKALFSSLRLEYMKVETESPPAEGDDETRKGLDREVAIVTLDGTGDGEVMSRANDLPLIVKFRYGSGEVWLMTFDPGSEVIRDAQNLEDIWVPVLGISKSPSSSGYSPNPYERGYRDFSSVMRDLHGRLSTISGVRHISLGALILIFLVYIAVIGPIDYFVLKRLNKLSWTHLTFIGYVLIFSVFSYLYTYRMKGGEMHINKQVIVDMHPETGRITGTSIMMVFSPQNNTYVLPVGKDSVIAPANIFTDERMYYSRGYSGVTASRTTVTTDSKELSVQIPIWSSQFVKAQWASPFSGDVDSSLAFSRRRLTGHVVNNLDMKITAVKLFYRDSVIDLGSMEPGQTKVIDHGIPIGRDRSPGINMDSTGLSPYVAISTFPKTWYGSEMAKQYAEEAIRHHRSLSKGSMDSLMDNPGRAVLVMQCDDFDDGIHVEGWESARGTGSVCFRRICTVEN